MMDPMLFEAENAGYANGLIHITAVDLLRPVVEVTNMDRKLFEAVISGKVNDLEGLLGGEIDALQQVTPMKDTTIHIAARHGHSGIIESMHRRCPGLITEANSIGDTPLHIAARAGHLHMVKCLLKCARNTISLSSRDLETGRVQALEFIRKGNRENHTLMHEAVRYGHLEMVEYLIGEDPELLCIDDSAGESPLHIAVEKGEREIIQRILENDSYSYNGPNGRTALHASIIHKKTDIAKMLLRKKPELIKVGDDNKRSALHFASTLGVLDSVVMLLDYDTSTAYFLDKDGCAPIHLSACFGRVNVMKYILECCPDLEDLIDGKCRNLLHIAIDSQQVSVVRYILQEKKLERLVNGRDKDGNAPLHQATINNYPYIVNLLVRNKGVDVMAFNRNRLTALDIARSQSHERTEDTKELVLATLLFFTNPSWHTSGSVWMEMLLCGVKQRLMSINWYKDKTNILLVVATLVATVTFAAGFTMPGGYQSDGMPTLLRLAEFRKFVWWDSMAMYLSTLAVISLVWVQFVRHLPATFILLYSAQVLTILALECMSLAFISGLNLTLGENTNLSKNISGLGYTFCILAMVTIIAYLSPLLYIHAGYIYYRSWISQLSKAVFRSPDANKQGHWRNDISMLFCYCE